jgi:hypothetical protein
MNQYFTSIVFVMSNSTAYYVCMYIVSALNISC